MVGAHIHISTYMHICTYMPIYTNLAYKISANAHNKCYVTQKKTLSLWELRQ